MLNKVLTNNRAVLLIFQAEITESLLVILLYPKPTMGLEKIFQNKGFQEAQKRLFRLLCCKWSTSQESHITNLLSRIHKKFGRHYLLYSPLRAHHGWALRKIFKIEVPRRPENAILNVILTNKIAILILF